MCGSRRTRTCTRRRRPPTRRRAHIAGTRSLAASAATPDSPGSPHRCRTTTGTPQPTSDSARPLVVAPHSRAVDFSGQMNTPIHRYQADRTPQTRHGNHRDHHPSRRSLSRQPPRRNVRGRGGFGHTVTPLGLGQRMPPGCRCGLRHAQRTRRGRICNGWQRACRPLRACRSDAVRGDSGDRYAPASGRP